LDYLGGHRCVGKCLNTQSQVSVIQQQGIPHDKILRQPPVTGANARGRSLARWKGHIDGKRRADLEHYLALPEALDTNFRSLQIQQQTYGPPLRCSALP
jgi:hypothetical protein